MSIPILNASVGMKLNMLGCISIPGTPNTEVFWVVIFEGMHAEERKKELCPSP